MAISKREYLQTLIQTSKDGKFPSVRPKQDCIVARCLYRTNDGRACAFGLLIPDNRYCANMEEFSSSRIIEKYKLQDVIPEGLDHNDIREIQRVHDKHALDSTETQVIPWKHKSFVNALLSLGCFAEFAGDKSLVA